MSDVERMSRVDTAWLRMDNDVNLMMIVGVWLLTPAITLDTLRARVADKLLKYERFRKRAVLDAVGAAWVPDTAFDIGNHVLAATLRPEPGESERHALQRLCGELAMTPLSPAHPLWQFHLIDGYEGGSALIARIHHCIGDGIALISVMMSITDGGNDPPKRRKREADPAAGDGDWLSDAVLKPLTDFTSKAIAMYGGGVARSVEMLANPSQPLLGSLDMARTGLKVINDVAALAVMPDDSPTLLKGKPAGRKVVAWSEPMPLDDVKAIGKSLGCTVNDVLLSCVAGAIGAYLRAQGQEPAGKEIRAMVPVNLRPLDKAWQLGNRFGLAPLVLPIGIHNPVQRVYAVRRRMGELKGSYQPLLAFAVLSASGLFIKPVQDAVLGMFAKKATAVMTNVPGPARPLQFCGSTLRQTMFWVPASGDIGVGVSILSYGGGVQFGLITDAALCSAPQAIIDQFEPEFAKLSWLALMLPWAGQADIEHHFYEPSRSAMTISVEIDLGYQFEVKAPFDDVFATLSDVPTSAGFFPKVDKLTDLGGNAYRWEMEKVGTAQVNIQTVYASKYTVNKAKGTVTWTPVKGQGNALVGGSWKLSDNKTSTALEFKVKGTVEVPLPGLMKMVVAPVVKSEFEKLVEKYIDNLIKRFGGEV